MAYARELEQARVTIKVQMRILIGTAIAVLILLLLLMKALETVKVDIRPGLSTRTLVQEGQIPSENIYSFGLLIFQQLNRWQNDGDKDYPAQIARLKPFMTDRFSGQLMQDVTQRRGRGELQSRTRSVAQPPEITFNASRIKQTSPTSWVLTLDLELLETVRGQIVKAPIIRYPLRIVLRDADSERNPYGLLLDGYAEEPRRLSAAELKELGIAVPEVKS